eukprot:TRINITY_DN102067_c0_g1_i1.p1 TRINITY_DN102067_c0_g1~~TRINITY_DN102067_c0_g1_i1.p1  ORF type:complete len:920 (-),score=238.05 TRINITY_DN102067_c0_g1_i1:81-2792(-)
MADAAGSWATALKQLSSKKLDDAKKLGADMQAKGSESGLKLPEAIGATITALALLCKADDKAASEFLETLKSIGATWSETAALLACKGSGGVTGPWGKAADAANTLAGKAKGEAATALKTAMSLSGEVGTTWTEQLTDVSVKDLNSFPREDESALQAAAAAPAKITDPKLKAPVLVRAALAQIKLAMPQTEDAFKNSKQAKALFHDLGDVVGEGTALRAMSLASGVDTFAAFQSANQSMKAFKAIGHVKGQAAAVHAIAKAHMAKLSTEDALFKCGEAMKLARQIGDRTREIAIHDTMVEACLLKGDADKALTAANDALAMAQNLGDKALEAHWHCQIAKAQGSTTGKRAAAGGVRSAQQALALYKELGQKDGECAALQAMAAASKARDDATAVLNSGKELAAQFQQDGDILSEAACKHCIAQVYLDHKEPDDAMTYAEDALACYRGAKDSKGEAKALQLMAAICLARSEPSDALIHAEEACTLFSKQEAVSLESRDAEIDCLKMQVEAHLALGSLAEALSLVSEQQEHFKNIDDKKGEGNCLLMQAQLARVQGKQADALKVLVQAPPLFMAVGDRRGEAESWYAMGRIYLEQGKVDLAQRAAETCSLAYRKLGDRLGRAQSCQFVADIFFASCQMKDNKMQGVGTVEDALKAAKEAASLYEDLGKKDSLPHSLHTVANGLLMTDRSEEALRTAKEAVAAFKPLRNPIMEASALLVQAAAYLKCGDFGEARSCAAEAEELFRGAEDPVGVTSVKDFLNNLPQYESGKLTPDAFFGFSIAMSERTMEKLDKKRQKPKVQVFNPNLREVAIFRIEEGKNPKVELWTADGFELRNIGGTDTMPDGDKQTKRGARGRKGGDTEETYQVQWTAAKKTSKSPSRRRSQSPLPKAVGLGPLLTPLSVKSH